MEKRIHCQNGERDLKTPGLEAGVANVDELLRPPPFEKEEEPHTCVHCQDICLGESLPRESRSLDANREGDQEPRIKLEFDYKDSFRKAEAGCSFFQWCLGLPESSSWRKPTQERFFVRNFPHSGHLRLRTSHTWRRDAVLYAEPGDSAASFISRRPPNRNVTSDESFEKALGWIDACVKGHTQCAILSSDFMPTRLIDVGTGTRLPKLVFTEGAEPKPYAALSYCWGMVMQKGTIHSNLAAHLIQLTLEETPRTIRDAIYTTRRLDIRFLWVDSLCILQDDEDDVAREMARMPEIFGNAHVTISASDSRDCEKGFLNLKELREDGREWQDSNNKPLPTRLRFSHSGQRKGSVIVDPRSFYSLESSWIHTRAWTMQERLLSPRILDYGSRQMRFICQTDGVLYDGGPVQGAQCLAYIRNFIWKKDVPLRDGTRMHGHFAWRDLIEKYTGRELGVPDDRLPALTGLAKKFGEILSDDEYLAGIWRKDLVVGLAWHTHRGREAEPKTRMVTSRRFRGPSWSWCSVNYPVKMRFMPPKAYPMVKLLHADIELVSAEAPYGAVRSGRLTLRAKVNPSELGVTGDAVSLHELGKPEHALKNCRVVLDHTHDESGEVIRPPSHVWIMSFAEWTDIGLLLTTVSSSGGLTMRRIGVVRSRAESTLYMWNRGCDFQTITLV